ncbi:DUF805 domain-containing protein [Alloscardovia criceti]|uniref:DUF805 domain-containing protein n=1 Tax=Alloscardovia criceti TaxID=356828 RepID=UPI0003804752|nr:DUF805 domain-containing protein [Alloscardovia criceti]
MVTVMYAPWMGEPPLDQPFYGASPVQAVVRFFKKYAKFSGRASRSEFWWPQVFIWAILICLNVIGYLFAVSDTTSTLVSLVHLVCFVPWLSAACRRMHDVNLSGKWLWLLLLGSGIAVIAALVFAGIGLVVGMQDIFVQGEQNFDMSQFSGSSSFAASTLVLWLFAVLLIGFSIFSVTAFFYFMTKESVDAGVRFDAMQVRYAVIPGAGLPNPAMSTPAMHMPVYQQPYFSPQAVTPTQSVQPAYPMQYPPYQQYPADPTPHSYNANPYAPYRQQ